MLGLLVGVGTAALGKRMAGQKQTKQNNISRRYQHYLRSFRKVSSSYHATSLSIISVAPLDENEYSPGEEQADSLSSSQGKPKFRPYENGNIPIGNGNSDFPSLLNVPLGSDGQGSHDSHNDSGYSMRFRYSAGPSPSLSGTIIIQT